ncbi:MAG: hypothetical protein FJX67_01990 [Alphaproteobacteria bacterium]|nr:hypothetical protein [Alphaproteobacteria bacterium]
MNGRGATTAAIALALIAAAILAWARVHAGFADAVDIELWDETVYLARGLGWPVQSLADVAWDGALYSAYYNLLAALLGGPIAAFDWAWRLTGLLAVLCLGGYAALIAGPRAVIAVAVPAFILLVSIRQIELAPRITLFLAALVLAGLVLARLVRGRAAGFVAIAAVALVASYVRTEMVIAVLAAVAVAVFLARRDRRPRALLASLAVLAAFATVVALGVHPVADPIGRMHVAMSQHVALNWVRWTGAPDDPFTDHEEIIAALFPGAARWWAWSASDPAAFLRHLADNAVRAPLALASIFVHPPIMLPGASRTAMTIEAAVLSVLCVAAIGWAFVRHHAAMLECFGVDIAKLAILAAPGLAVAVLIHPRPHYLLVPAVLVLAVLAMALAAVVGRRPARLAAALLVVLALVAAAPAAFAPRYGVAAAPDAGRLPVRATIATLRGFGFDPLVEFGDVVGAVFGPGAPWWRWPLVAPSVVVDHVAHNLAMLPREAVRFLAHPPLLVPATIEHGARIEAAAIGITILAIVAAALMRRRVAFIRLARPLAARLAVVVSPGIIAAILLYPHQHYLFVGFIAALALLGTAIGALRLGAGWSPGVAALVALALLAATPAPFTSHLERRSPAEAKPLATRATIAAIGALGLAGPYTLLADGLGLRAYLPGATGDAILIDKGRRPFAAFLAAVDPDLVVHAAWVGRLHDFRNEATLAAFLADPGAAGFRAVPVPGTDRTVFVHRRVACPCCP